MVVMPGLVQCRAEHSVRGTQRWHINIQTLLDKKIQKHLLAPYRFTGYTVRFTGYPAQCMYVEPLIRMRRCTTLFYFRICMVRKGRE